MTPEEDDPIEQEPEESVTSKPPRTTIVLLVVVALFAGVAIAKFVAPKSEPSVSGGASLTTVHSDAVADYEAARETGRPIYILFHSLS